MRPVLFVGSSIFEQWTQCGDAVDGPSVNEAIGGTTSRDWLPRLEPLLKLHRPRLVACYVGSNDFNNAIDFTETKANVLELAAITATHCPLLYASIIRGPAKRGHWDQLIELQQALAGALPDRCMLVDLNPVFRTDSGVLRHDFFVEDGVHLTPDAYDALTHFMRPVLAGALEMTA